MRKTYKLQNSMQSITLYTHTLVLADRMEGIRLFLFKSMDLGVWNPELLSGSAFYRLCDSGQVT